MIWYGFVKVLTLCAQAREVLQDESNVQPVVSRGQIRTRVFSLTDEYKEMPSYSLRRYPRPIS